MLSKSTSTDPLLTVVVVPVVIPKSAPASAVTPVEMMSDAPVMVWTLPQVITAAEAGNAMVATAAQRICRNLLFIVIFIVGVVGCWFA